MKTTDFKLWDVFENTDGVLGVIYLITKERAYVISSKGSLYQLKMHDYPVSYKVVDIEPDDVFRKFFKNNLCGKKGEKELFNIGNRYYDYKRTVQTVTNRRLLITI